MANSNRSSIISLGGAKLVYFNFEGRRVLTRLPNEYIDIERSVRRLFSMEANATIEIKLDIPTVAVHGRGPVEADPSLWPTIKDNVLEIWIEKKIIDCDGFTIIVQTLTGKRINVWLTGKATVLALKEKIQDVEGIPPEQQIYVIAGKQMASSYIIRDHGITDGSVMHLILKLRGGKPVIYLSSSTPITANIHLRLIPSWSFSALYPIASVQKTEGGEVIEWEVLVKPDGTIRHYESGADVSYLYWEAMTNPSTKLLSSPPASVTGSPQVGAKKPNTHTDIFDPLNPDIRPANSILLSIGEVAHYLDKVLKVLGLHTEARTSFITYWLPDLLKHPNIALRFLPQVSYEMAAPLKVTPEPSKVTRVFMVWCGVAPELVEVDWKEALNRGRTMDVVGWKNIVGIEEGTPEHGLKVLEWGGMEVL